MDNLVVTHSRMDASRGVRHRRRGNRVPAGVDTVGPPLVAHRRMSDVIFNSMAAFFLLGLPLFFVSRAYWRSWQARKQQSKEEKRRQTKLTNIQQGKLLGAIFIILSLGLSIGPSDLHDIPWEVRALVFAAGIVLIAAAGHDTRKEESRALPPDFIAGKDGLVQNKKESSES